MNFDLLVRASRIIQNCPIVSRVNITPKIGIKERDLLQSSKHYVFVSNSWFWCRYRMPEILNIIQIVVLFENVCMAFWIWLICVYGVL